MHHKIAPIAHGVVGIGGASEGFFTLEVRPANCPTFIPVGAFPNLITDAGLLHMGSFNNYLNSVFLGTSNTPPQVGDTQLGNQIGQILSGTALTNGVVNSSPDHYAWSRRTWTGSVGQIVGNLSEIGVGNAANNLFSHALILDANGLPTTLTLLADEQLRVTYEHRYRLLSDTVSGQVTLSGNIGGTYDYEATTFEIGNAAFCTAHHAQNRSGDNGIANGFSGATGRSDTSHALIGGEGLTRTFSLSASLTQANFPGGITHARKTMGNASYIFQFDPPIPKTASDILSLQFSHTWGRA